MTIRTKKMPDNGYGPMIAGGHFESEDFAVIFLALKKLYECGIDYEEGLPNIHQRSGRLAFQFYHLLHKIQEEALRENIEKDSLR